jgi:dTDP-glucose 4,6-dehydratase
VDILGKPRELITFVKDRLGHDLRYALDCSRIHELGWRPLQAFDKGLDLTVAWYRSHEDWWRRLKYQSEDFKKFHESYYKDRK